MKNNIPKRIGFFLDAYQINLKYLKEVAKDDPAYLSVLSLTTILNTLFPLVNIIFPKLVVDAIISNDNMERVVFLIAILFGANVIFGLFNSFVSSQYLNVRGSMSSMRFLTKISRKASELDLSQIERKETIDKMELAKNVIYRGIHNDIISSISGLVSAAFMVVTTIGIISNASFWFVIIVVIICITSTIISFRIEHDNVEVQRETQKVMTQMNYFTDLLDGKAFIKEIRLYNLGRWIECHCTEKMIEINQKFKKNNKKWSGWRALQGFISNALNYGAYMFFAVLALLKKITIGDFTMYFQAVSTFRSNFDFCLSIFSQVMLNAEYIAAYNDFMSIESESLGEKTTDVKHVSISSSDTYTIDMHDVSFKYTNDGNMILKHVNLQLMPNCVYAIVGENGAGKTTLINLICRFYDPTEGEILINNTNIRKLPIFEYRALFSALFQGFNNISFSIADNISLDRVFDESVAETIMESIGMSECIKELPNGYKTYLNKNLDDDGIFLSGGQNQRLAIARSIYRNAPFIILDEPTSSLDPLAEDALIKLIRTQMKEKTILYVSHRLASVHIADKVIYVHNNTVEDFGYHDEIYARNSNYREFYDAQAKYYR